MLRPWINSDKVNNISVHSERFFTRLIMVVDDFGCFYADKRLLRANLFPLLLDQVKDGDIIRWLSECQKAGLLVIYDVEGKKYLKIIDFKQRLDKAKSKFPQPVNELPEVVNETPAELEEEVEKEEKKKREGFAPPALDDVVQYMTKKLDDFTAMGEAQNFINYYSSNGWKVGKNKMIDWPAAARGWMSRMKEYGVKVKKTNMDQILKQFEEIGDQPV